MTQSHTFLIDILKIVFRFVFPDESEPHLFIIGQTGLATCHPCVHIFANTWGTLKVMGRTSGIVCLLLVVTTVASCSVSKKAKGLGDRLIDRGGVDEDLGKSWNKGEGLIEKASDLETDADKVIKKGKDLVKQGETKKEKANKMKKEGEKLQSDAVDTLCDRPEAERPGGIKCKPKLEINLGSE